MPTHHLLYAILIACKLVAYTLDGIQTQCQILRADGSQQEQGERADQSQRMRSNFDVDRYYQNRFILSSNYS